MVCVKHPARMVVAFRLTLAAAAADDRADAVQNAVIAAVPRGPTGAVDDAGIGAGGIVVSMRGHPAWGVMNLRDDRNARRWHESAVRRRMSARRSGIDVADHGRS